MQRILYLVQKEFLQILREKTFIGLIFGAPFIQIVILGFAITTDINHVPLGIVDNDRSAFSRRIVQSFTATESFDFKGLLRSQKEAIAALDEGRLKIVIIIPGHFERDLKGAQRPVVQALVDGVDGNSAGMSMAYLNQIAIQLQKEWMQEMGQLAKQMRQVHLTAIEPRMQYNSSLESVNNIVPGILAVMIMLITAFLTGMSIVREREIGTLEQLMVTPIKNVELIMGKVLPLVIVAFLLLNVGILAAGFIFGLWMKGNIFALYFMTLIFSLSTLGLGIFASTIAHTQQQAMFIAYFFMIFAILLSGFFIPIENMPPLIQTITYVNPLRYFMIVIREIYLKGTALSLLWREGLAMGVFGLASILLSSLRFHKRLG